MDQGRPVGPGGICAVTAGDTVPVPSMVWHNFKNVGATQGRFIAVQHVGLNTWTSESGTPPPDGHTGLHHFVIVYPDRCELGRAVRRLLDHDHPIDGAEDHDATVSVYLRDPDGNGIELYYDRPREEWFDARGNPILKAEAFDPRELPEEPNDA